MNHLSEEQLTLAYYGDEEEAERSHHLTAAPNARMHWAA